VLGQQKLLWLLISLFDLMLTLTIGHTLREGRGFIFQLLFLILLFKVRIMGGEFDIVLAWDAGSIVSVINLACGIQTIRGRCTLCASNFCLIRTDSRMKDLLARLLVTEVLLLTLLRRASMLGLF
jgi:hypothetical protein